VTALHFPAIYARGRALERIVERPACDVRDALLHGGAQALNSCVEGRWFARTTSVDLLLCALDRLAQILVDDGEHVCRFAAIIPPLAQQAVHDLFKDAEREQAEPCAIECARMTQDVCQLRGGPYETRAVGYEELAVWRDVVRVCFCEAHARGPGERVRGAGRSRRKHCSHSGADAGLRSVAVRRVSE
jgi:hypothetical protein